MAFKLKSGFDIVLHYKNNGEVKPYYPISKTSNIISESGENVDELLAQKADIEHAVPDAEPADNLRFLRNDNSWQTLPDASSKQKGVVQVATSVVSSESEYTVAHINTVKQVNDRVDQVNTSLSNYILKSDKGKPNGVATLNQDGIIPTSQLPSYVDDIIDGYIDLQFNKFYSDPEHSHPITLESGKIYVDIPTRKIYRYSGSILVEISASLALGETSSTAFRGDYGKIAYDHSQKEHARVDATKTEASELNGYIKINGNNTIVYKHPSVHGASETNPHGTTKGDVGLANVENLSGVQLTDKYVTKGLITDKLGFTPAPNDLATQFNEGLMSAEDKSKLDNMMRIVVGETNSESNVLWLKTI